MKIVYLDNSGFAVYIGRDLLLFDYYNARGNGLAEGMIDKAALEGVERVYVFASHRHFDHFNRVIFRLREMHGDVRYILDSGIFRFPEDINITRMSKGTVYDDGHLRAIGCPSTDIGISILVEVHGHTFVHAGDFNCWHWAGNDDAETEAFHRRDYTQKLAVVAAADIKPEVVFFPLDPRLQVGIFDGALEFVEAIRPKLFVPMHMQGQTELGREFRDMTGLNVFCYDDRGDSMEF